MSGLRVKPSIEWRSLLGTIQAKIALSLLFALGLGVQGFRVLSAWQESSALEAEVGVLSSELLAEASAEATPEPQAGRGVPVGRLPGPILLDAVRLLNEAEIYDYRYRFVEVPPPADAASAQAASTELIEDPSAAVTPAIPESELHPQSDASSETSAEPDAAPEDDWPALDLPSEVVPAPPEWKEWRLELGFDAAYPRAVKFLALLRADDRLWTVPRLVASRESGMLTVDCLLKTYTRPEAPGGIAEPPASERDPELVWSDPERDPFRGSWASRRGTTNVASAPSLGGVLLGARKRAWLDGRAVDVGGRVGGWTVTDIRAGEVVLKHDGGATVRLAARGRDGVRG